MKALPIMFIAALVFTTSCFDIQPRNTISDCREQCMGSNKSGACYDFCNCIHNNCQPLDKCLNDYNKAAADTIRAQQNL